MNMNTKQTSHPYLNARTRWLLYEIEKQELQQKNLPPVEYEVEIRALCNKYRI